MFYKRPFGYPLVFIWGGGLTHVKKPEKPIPNLTEFYSCNTFYYCEV